MKFFKVVALSLGSALTAVWVLGFIVSVYMTPFGIIAGVVVLVRLAIAP